MTVISLVPQDESIRRRFSFLNHQETIYTRFALPELGSGARTRTSHHHPLLKEMLLSLVQTPFPSFPVNYKSDIITNHSSLLPNSSLLPPSCERFLFLTDKSSSSFASRQRRRCGNAAKLTIRGSFLETPVVWVGRICIFYALVKSGVVGSKTNPFVSDLDSDATSVAGESGDLGFSKWLEIIRGKPDKEAADKRKLVSKWHPTTKGTLRRNYRVPSKSEGRRLLKAIASLLSDDDHFTDATSHKGCQIRRESAHGESVCCNNVRALFDELPTPHLIVEITPFPAGPLTERDYGKAEKLERVLRSGPSV